MANRLIYFVMIDPETSVSIIDYILKVFCIFAAESCRSGRTGQTRNLLNPSGFRGFESLAFRRKKRFTQKPYYPYKYWICMGFLFVSFPYQKMLKD